MYAYFNNTTKSFVNSINDELLITSERIPDQELHKLLGKFYEHHNIEPLHESECVYEIQKYIAEL